MSFANPALLIGLLAVAVPIVIHLINRRRAVQVSFPALEFLLRSNRRLARRLKIKQLVLLALRVSIFVLVPLAMARPLVRCGGSADSVDDRLPASVVFIVDDSASMTAGLGDDTRFVRAAEEATRRVRALRPWDQAALVFASSAPLAAVPELTEDRALLIDALADHEPRAGGSDLAAAFTVAREVQATSRLPARRTVVFADQTVAAWDPTPNADGLGAVEIVDLAEGREIDNIAITQLAYEETATGSYRIDATVLGIGLDAPSEETVMLEIDGRPAGAAVVAVGPGTPGVASFEHAFDGLGPYAVAARLDAPRGHRADDVRYVPLVPDRSLRVLVVDGDARSVSYNDEVFYLRRALDVPTNGRREVEATVVVPDDFAGTGLEGFDAVVLANPAGLPVTEVSRLEDFVRGGGGLLFTAGGRVDPARWNSLFGALLPKPIRSVKVLASPNDPDASIKATRLGNVDRGHPVFTVFDLPGGESVGSVIVYAHLLLEPEVASDTRVVASFGDGGPALLERSLGRGRVMLWTTSIDLDWTDLPIRTAYLPLVRRIVGYLARRGGESQDEADVGERLALDLVAIDPERVVVEGPDGERAVLPIEDGEAGYVPRRPGLHRVFATIRGEEREMPELMFAANTPIVEADPARVDPTVVESVVATATTQTSAAVDGRRGTPVWPLLLFLAIIALYLESLFAIRRRLWVRLAGRRRQQAL